MNFYLMPTAPITIGSGPAVQTFNGPKYFSTDLAGLNLACVPYGAEAFTLVSLASPNAKLQAEPDVYSFPADLTKLVQPADVTALDNFCVPANIPSAFVIAGMTFAEVLRQIAQIHLLAQFVSGATGKSIFNGGATLSTQYSLLPPSSGLSSTALFVGVSTSKAVNPLFDFSVVQPTNIVGDVLLTVSQQFTSVIDFNGANL